MNDMKSHVGINGKVDDPERSNILCTNFSAKIDNLEDLCPENKTAYKKGVLLKKQRLTRCKLH